MKTFEEFLKAFETDEALKAKVKEALETAEVKTEEAKTALLVQIAGENGYNVSVENFTKHQADGHELDEAELGLVSGGAFCNSDYEECNDTFEANDYCVVNDECDYALHLYKHRPECSSTYNSITDCVVSDECCGIWNHY